MDKKTASLASVLAVSSVAAAHAAAPAPPISRANAYAALLRPIPNAAEALKSADAAAGAKTGAKVELAQYDGYYYHHHHHHHHHHGYYRYYRPWYYHHHHHHHHHHHWQGW